MKKILIDFTQIPLQKVGVGIYAENLVSLLSLSDSHLKYIVLVQDDDRSIEKYRNNNLEVQYIRASIFRVFLFRVLMEQVYIPYIILKKRIDVIHSLHYSFPFISFSAKRVVTIHDLTFFKFPELHTFVKRNYFRFFTKIACKKAKSIICVSDSTRRDLIKIANVKNDMISVIPLGKSEEYNPNYSETEIDQCVRKYKITKPYILFIGTIEPRKNIKTLIKAFYKFSMSFQEYILVIVGKKGWHYDAIFELIEDLKIADKIIFTGFVEENEKPVLLNGCEVFVYPSLYEGFGIPVLEAMACGTPVITSNISSMPEVSGDAASLINPQKKDELYNKLMSVISNGDLRKEMKRKGIEQAKKFNWENTAKNTIELYELVG